MFIIIDTVIYLHLQAGIQVRSLLRVLYSREANIIPDEKVETLIVQIHHFASITRDRLMEWWRFFEERNRIKI